MPSKTSVRDKEDSDSSSLWLRAINRQETWENKFLFPAASGGHSNGDPIAAEEFLDVIYWMRQLLSIILGILWGIIPLQGFVGMLLFLALNVAVVYLYCALYQRVDEEEYGGIWELLKEGFVTSYALFLVNWIIFYTTFHFG